MQEIGGLAITNNSLHNEYCAEQNQLKVRNRTKVIMEKRM